MCAAIVAEQLELPAAHPQMGDGDMDTAPYWMGRCAGPSTPTVGATRSTASGPIRAKPAQIAAHRREVGKDDLHRTGFR